MHWFAPECSIRKKFYFVEIKLLRTRLNWNQREVKITQMKPVVILCSSGERDNLIEAFNQKQIATEPCRVNAPGISLVALKIKHDTVDIMKVVECANDFARQTGRTLQARCDDADGKAHPVDVTEKNVNQIVEATKGEVLIFLFCDREPPDIQNRHVEKSFMTIDGIDVPDDNLKLWRYMSFDRFEQLVQKRKLCFSRIDQFSDYKEGCLTTATSDRADAEIPPKLAGIMAAHHQFLNWNYWYASCWNLCETESNLLWRSYGSPKTSDNERYKVAIRTSVRNLLSSICCCDIFFGKMKYVDFKKDDPYLGDDGVPNGSAVFTKQQEYKAEAEVRVAIQATSSIHGGLISEMECTPKLKFRDIQLSKLIEEVVIEAVPREQTPSQECNHHNGDSQSILRIVKEAERRIQKVKQLVESIHLRGVPVRMSTIL